MKTLLLAGALAAPFAVLADDTSTLLDPIVVTPSGTQNRASDTLAPLLVIGREEIERAQANDLGDLLRFYAGFDVDRAGGPGQTTQVRVRGGETDHVLLLIDGVRSNPASSGPTLQWLAPENIERIEIVKGPRSTLYGSEGMAATINVITRGSAQRTALQLRAGAYGTQEAGVSFAQQVGARGYSVSAQRLTSEGFPTCADSDLKRSSERTTLAGKAQGKTGVFALGGSALDSRGNAQYLNFGCPGGSFDAEQEFHTQMLSANVAVNLGPAWESTLTVSRALDDLQQQQAPDYARTRRPRLDWRNVIALGEANRLSAGIEYEHERAEALFTGFGTTFVHERRDIGAVRLQDELDHGRNHALAAVRYTHDSGFGEHLTWNAEYGFDVLSKLRLIATAGTGFRAPTFLERSPGFFGNPDLKPEESRSYELGALANFAPGHSLDLRAFRTDWNNLIAGFPPVNVGEARSAGVDLSYRLVGKAWSLQTTAIAQDPKDQTTGLPLARRAKRSAALKLDRRLGAHSLGLDLVGTGTRRDTDFSTFPARDVSLPGYALLNLRASLELDQHTGLRVSVENLLDTDYQTAFGYRQPGASFYLGLRYSL